MKVCAIICEYNPFHTGHAHQMRMARERSGCDFLLCVMSGPFVQRGEPAIVDKWTRARSALLMGADLVLELPSIFALRAAPDFAMGGASLIDALDVVTHLSFGSENDDLSYLRGFVGQETKMQRERIRNYLSQGHSFARAATLAGGQELAANALLGIEYLRALEKLQSALEPVIVLREIPHSAEELGGLASSTAIRLALERGEEEEALCACPKETRPLLTAAKRTQGGFASLEAFDRLLLEKLRSMEPSGLARYPGVSEGLENRLHQAARQVGSIGALLDELKTRRYPQARLKRSLMHILLGNDRAFLERHPSPEYARILGFQKSAEPLLHEIAQKSRLPLIAKAAQHKNDEMFLRDVRAQDLWALGLANPAARGAGQDFTNSPVIL